jgi:hypothetical protein
LGDSAAALLSLQSGDRLVEGGFLGEQFSKGCHVGI